MTSPTSSGVRSARRLRMVFLLAVIFCCSSLPSSAQGTAATQAPGQPQSTSATGRSRSLAEHLARLTVRAGELVQVLQTETLRLMRWVEYLAWLLALFLIPASAVREWHENAGKGRNLLWWFGRLAACLLLFGAAIPIIDALYVVGKDIAEGNESRGEQSVLFEFYATHRDSFNQSYDKFIDGNFKVKGLDGNEFAVRPIDHSEPYVGVISDQGVTIRNPISNLNDSSYTMPRLFAFMSVARGVMEAGDLWLIVLGGLLMLAFKLVAPLMVVLGIDRKLSQRTVTGYVWGLVILTLVWPSVSYIVRALAYMGGNLAMAMGDTDQLYTWTNASQKALRNPLAQPLYTVAFGSLMMLGAGLALWMSPFLAYSIAMGRVFEGVAQQASQLAGSIVSTAVEWVSASVGASIGRQADNAQIQGVYDSEQARNQGELAFGNSGAMSRRMQAIGLAQSQHRAALGGIWGAWAGQTGTTKNQEAFAIEGAKGQATYQKALEFARGVKETEDGIANTKQQLENIRNQANAEAWHSGGTAITQAGSATGFARGDSKAGAITAGIGLGMNTVGTSVKLMGDSEAARQAMKDRAGNTQKYLDTVNGTPEKPGLHDVYRDFTIRNQKEFAKDQLATIDVSRDFARDGVNAAVGMQIGTANGVYRVETQANQARFDAQMDAAKITRNAGIEAANFRAMQHVLSQVSSKVARDIEKNIEMRF
jgi:hypothetical protein